MCVTLWTGAQQHDCYCWQTTLALSRDAVVSNVGALYVPGNFNALATFASWAVQFFVSICHQISITPQSCPSKPCSVDLFQPTQISPTLLTSDKTCDHQNKTPFWMQPFCSHTLALANGNLGFKECASRAALCTSLGIKINDLLFCWIAEECWDMSALTKSWTFFCESCICHPLYRPEPSGGSGEAESLSLPIKGTRQKLFL